MIILDRDTDLVRIDADHDQMLIEALVQLYHQKAPSVSWESYQEGLQAGIRYALLATKTKIPGINA